MVTFTGWFMCAEHTFFLHSALVCDAGIELRYSRQVLYHQPIFQLLETVLLLLFCFMILSPIMISEGCSFSPSLLTFSRWNEFYPSVSAFFLLSIPDIKARALSMLGKCSMVDPHSLPQWVSYSIIICLILLRKKLSLNLELG